MVKLSFAAFLAGSLLLLLACSGKEEKEEVQTETQETPVQQEQEQSGTPAADTESAGAPQVGFAGEKNLVGTWGFIIGQNEMRVTYRPDGSFASESVTGGARLQLHGTYEFDGRKLVSRPTEFTTSDTTQEAIDKVKLLNERMKQDPQAAVEVSIIRFADANQFTATAENGAQMIYVRLRE